MSDKSPSGAELAAALGVNESRVSQLKREGMPTDSVESALAWRAARRVANERAGHIAIPVQPISLGGLDEILNSISGTEPSGDSEMDTRIRQQVELCELTRQQFLNAAQSGDPSQSKLYTNFDRSIATLLRLEKERQIRLQENGRLVDADEAAARYGRILGQLRSLLERAELTFAPKANPENPTKALKAYRDFRDDIFRKLAEYAPQVVSKVVASELPPPEAADEGEAPKDDKAGGLEWEEPNTEE